MTPLELVLSKFSRVRRVSATRYKVCCPAHDDRNPSMDVRELDDGKVWIKCWTGCTKEKILSATGLKWSDLYPEHMREERKRQPRPVVSSEALDWARYVDAYVKADQLAGKRISDADKEVYKKALRILSMAGVSV